MVRYEFKDGEISKGLRITVLNPANHSTLTLIKRKDEVGLEKAEGVREPSETAPKLETDRARKKFKVLKKGVARRRRESEEMGNKNEDRLHKLVRRLIGLLESEFSDIIQEAVCTRSGHHNPKKGKIDLRNSAGDDVDFRLDVKDGGGRIFSRWLIWDSKSSMIGAVKFNGKIIYFPGQTEADLKKAIVVNKQRSDKEIIAEIVSDLISVGAIVEDTRRRILELVPSL